MCVCVYCVLYVWLAGWLDGLSQDESCTHLVRFFCALWRCNPYWMLLLFGIRLNVLYSLSCFQPGPQQWMACAFCSMMKTTTTTTTTMGFIHFVDCRIHLSISHLSCGMFTAILLKTILILCTDATLRIPWLSPCTFFCSQIYAICVCVYAYLT